MQFSDSKDEDALVAVRAPWRAGGAILEFLALYQDLADWQHARSTAGAVSGAIRPPLRPYVDLLAHALVMPARSVLGAATALVMSTTGHTSNAYAAIGVGAAAPAVLATLGSIPEISRRLAQRPNELQTPRQQLPADPTRVGPGNPADAAAGGQP